MQSSDRQRTATLPWTRSARRLSAAFGHGPCRHLGLAFALAAALLLLAAAPTFAQDAIDTAATDTIDFNRDVRPILMARCIACHGPDEDHREADIRLDTADGLADVVEPGDLDSSLLWERVATDDPDMRMPPADHDDALAPESIATLKRWIEQGAPFARHWSLVPPSDPPRPTTPFDDWCYNDIDRFVAAGWASHGLAPNPPADPARLLRRVALDLTGLPPSEDQAQRFLTNPDLATYEQIVDELLASPAYGEHWAAMWMDLGRYADTMGYASDNPRTIWPWRDLLIQRLNENQTYDEFTREQLAGDLLPDATDANRLATAFHRNTLNNTEGGTNDEEFRTIAVKDRLNTTLNVWMGLTVRCAECHNHKYDPISQREYYLLLDFFNQTADRDTNDDAPTLAVEPIRTPSELDALDAKIRELENRLRESNVWKPLAPEKTEATGETRLTVLSDRSILAEGPAPEQETYQVEIALPAGRHTGLRLELLPHDSFAGRLGRGPNGSIALTHVNVQLKENDQWHTVRLSGAAADYTQQGHSIQSVIADPPGDVGWAVAHPRTGYRARHFAIFSLDRPIENTQPVELRITIEFRSKWPRTSAGRFRWSTTDVPDPAQSFAEGKLEPEAKRLAELQAERNRKIPVPVLVELPADQRRQTHVMIRGSYLAPGEPVRAAVPQALHAWPGDQPKNRLGLANWILDERNPLTARVAVNRYWARLFGRGIVLTEEDFGTQGTYPTHPELLDALAVDFRRDWDVKRLLKKIVMSATYRQSAQADPSKLSIDPDNLWLSRGPRNRLTAEALRDQALAISGLLSTKMYGPPVYPPNPVKRVASAFAGATVWNDSEGEDRFRRTLYTYVKRSAPHPLLENYDVGTRDVCRLRRITTNTPLQALQTFNDTMFMEYARALADDMLRHGSTPTAQIGWGFQRCTWHAPSPRQLEILVSAFEDHLSHYQQHEADASRLVAIRPPDSSTDDTAVPHRAAMTVIANILLNLDEVVTH